MVWLGNDPEDYETDAKLIWVTGEYRRYEIWVQSGNSEWLLHGSWSVEEDKVNISLVNELTFLIDNGFKFDFLVE